MHICRVGSIFHDSIIKLKMLHILYLSHMLQFLCFYIIFMLCHLSEMGNPSHQQVCVECFNQLVKEGRKKTENVCPQLRCDIIIYSLLGCTALLRALPSLITDTHPSLSTAFYVLACRNIDLLAAILDCVSSLIHFINLSWYLNIQNSEPLQLPVHLLPDLAIYLLYFFLFPSILFCLAFICH
jgi:hypothetical protein